MRTILISVLTSFMLLTGCSYTTNVTKDQRFERIMGAQSVCAKERLRLYGTVRMVSSGNDRYELSSVNQGNGNLLGTVGVGHEVKLVKITRHHDFGNVWEQLEGEIIFKGRLYPFCFYMGNSVHADGWTRITDSFEACRE